MMLTLMCHNHTAVYKSGRNWLSQSLVWAKYKMYVKDILVAHAYRGQAREPGPCTV
jgi:hypothetical protein